MMTGENPLFIRFFWEVDIKSLALNVKTHEESFECNLKWYPYFKGGQFRRWYGNRENVVNFKNDGNDLKKSIKYGERNPSFYFKNNVNWTKISSGLFSARVGEVGSLYDDAACQCLVNKIENIEYIIGYLNSKIGRSTLGCLSNTLNFSPGEIAKIPMTIEYQIFDFVNSKVKSCLLITKSEWNSHENSWEFEQNELVKQYIKPLRTAFESYKVFWSEKFYELHSNEEELNSQFIGIYGLQDELTYDVPLEEITILHEESKIVNNQLEIQAVPVLLQLISYSIGCMFGRYSLDKPGLILANQGETLQDYLQQIASPSFLPDDDNIIPILDGEWFNDDIVGRFNEFLKVAFGEEHFIENLRFIEDTLGKDIRKYLVKDFCNDHVKRYKKRPIYWMFSSPKGHFKALIYMHRYQPDVCSRMLNDYLLAFISKLESAKNTQTMFSLREDITGREKTLASKEIERLEDMLKDCRKYESTLFTIATQKISIDLDDGIKVNYQKFKEVLVPIKGLEKEEE